jgi:hypothetical protein
MRVPSAARRAWVIVLAAAAVVGCGASEREQVQAKVEQFVKAAASKDYKTICDQVLAPSLLERLAAGGIPCEQAMQVGFGRVHNPTLSIGRIIVAGSTASAITLSGARGQEASLQAIELVRTGAGWRISSLGSPVGGSSKGR